MICYIIRSSICPLEWASGIVGLGITNISFSARLSVRWGRRVESYFLGENFDMFHCPPVDLCLGLESRFVGLGIKYISFSAHLSVGGDE